MDRLRALAEAQGFFSRTDALAAGHDDNAIRAALRLRLWVHVRRGAYTFPDLVPPDPGGQHLVRAHAVARRLGHAVALSHVSAAIEHGLDIWNIDLTNVHVTRLDGRSGRTEAGVVHHEGFCVDDDVIEKDGVLVMRPARAAVEACTLGSAESGVVLLDSLLRNGCPRDELEAAFLLLKQWPDTRGLQIVVRFADGASGSAGEALARWLCYGQGLPAPILQFEVRDASGELIGISDFAWPAHQLLGEFDGRIKYGRLLRDGETPGDAVFREKCREDAMREQTGWRMVRLVWADLAQPAATAARIRRMLGQPGRLPSDFGRFPRYAS
ncbi:MAG: hypothetical protein ACTHKG_02730 [Nocardioides sp.]